jgi:hypothetical protein
MSYQQRSRDLQPTFYTATGGIIQALALTYLLSLTMDEKNPDLVKAFSSSLDAQIFWLKFLIAFEIIILVWHEYIAGLIYFQWTWTFLDSFIPFIMGIAEFVLVKRLDVHDLSPWLWGMAFVSTAGLLSYANQYHRAKQEFSHNQQVLNEVGFLRRISILSLVLQTSIFALGALYTTPLPKIELKIKRDVLLVIAVSASLTLLFSERTYAKLRKLR